MVAADSNAALRAEVRRLRALVRLVVTETDQDENGDMPNPPRGALLVLRDAARAALKPRPKRAVKWDGMAPCGIHGADYLGQQCTICPARRAALKPKRAVKR